MCEGNDRIIDGQSHPETTAEVIEDAVDKQFDLSGQMRFLEELRDVLNHTIMPINEVNHNSGVMFAAALAALIFLLGTEISTNLRAISLLVFVLSILLGVLIVLIGRGTAVGININELVNYHNAIDYGEMFNYEIDSRIDGIYANSRRFTTIMSLWYVQCLTAVVGLILIMLEVLI